MHKVSALKLIDEAILPVVLVLASKITVAFLVSGLFGLVWNFNLSASSNSLFFLNFTSKPDLYLVNSFSDLIMILVTSAGFVWVLFRHKHFGEENIHPIAKSKLHKQNQEFLIVTFQETYHQAAVWLSLSWFVLFIVFNNVILAATSQINLGIAFIVTAVLSILLEQNSKYPKY